MKIGHLEPPTDDLAQIPINSATTQQMLPETVKPDSFTPPKYQLDATTQQQLDFQGSVRERRNNHWYHTTYTDVNQHRRLRSHFSETLPHCNGTLPMGKGRNQ